MKILCVSDQIDPLVYTNSIRERFSDIDVVLSAGDLPLDYLDFIVSSLNKPVFFGYGNHNLDDFDYYCRRSPTTPRDLLNEEDAEERMAHGCGAVHAGSRVVKENDLIIAGLGGSMRYNKGDNQFTEFQMTLEIIRLIPGLLFHRLFHGRYLDILLTHASPLGIHDRPDRCHIGFKCFLWFMKTFRPRYLIHGHIHLYDAAEVRRTRYEDTLVINAYSHCLIETSEHPAVLEAAAASSSAPEIEEAPKD